MFPSLLEQPGVGDAMDWARWWDLAPELPHGVRFTVSE